MSSTLHALTVPKWGMSMEEGEVTQWRVSEGDTLAVGDEYVDIETSKIVNAAESPVAGTLVRITGQVGQTLQVGLLLGVVADGKATDAEVDTFIAAFVPDASGAARASGGDAKPAAAAPAPAAAKAAVAVAPASAAANALSEGPDDSEVNASTVARRIAKANNINLNNVTATGRNGRVSKSDVEQAAGIRVLAKQSAPSAGASSSRGPQRSTEDDSHVASTPVARRLARELNINLNDVTPTGKRGRVSKEDVEKYAVVSTGVAYYREEKLSGMRKTIASRLSESKQTIPHYRVSVDIEIDSLLSQRAYMNGELGHKISVNDFIIKASACALEQVPEVNVQYTGETIRQFDQVDVSIAVAIEGGLITPVVRNVGAKGLPQIAQESSDLARRAQMGTLGVDEFQGGTFSISNLGMFGVDQFDAIINLPQAAILAVAAGVKKPVVRGDSVVPATVMRVTLSADHRAIDGAVAAQFLRSLKGFLENPASMLL
ncbi:MAG: pyruvate dehydrogenase E2 component (dihydrolipoamide acetyltransferase) [Halioglobus sp.]|jgi:pyruvate dehydrogenase E2 component (dihydrolipoamide acetyltransferase)